MVQYKQHGKLQGESTVCATMSHKHISLLLNQIHECTNITPHQIKLNQSVIGFKSRLGG